MENVVTRKLLVAFKIVLLWVLITPNCVFWYGTLVFVPLDLWRQSPIASLSSPSPLPFVTKAIGKKEKQMAFYSVCKTKLRIVKAFWGVRNWWFYFFAAPFLQKERFFFSVGSKVKILGHKVGALFRKSVRVLLTARIPFDFAGFWHPIVVTVERKAAQAPHTQKSTRTTPTTQEILLHWVLTGKNNFLISSQGIDIGSLPKTQLRKDFLSELERKNPQVLIHIQNDNFHKSLELNSLTKLVLITLCFFRIGTYSQTQRSSFL